LGPRDQVLLRSQLRKAQDLTEAVAITTRALADLTKLAALAIPPIVPKLRLLSIRLRQISRRVVLLAYTLSDGRRGEALVELDAAVRDEQARSWAQALEKIEPIAVEKLSAINCPAVVPERVWQVIVEHVLSRVGAVTILQGISHLAARPEFSNPTRLADVLALLDDRGKAYSLLTRVIPERGAKALIDAADTGGHLPQCALIVGCFGLAGCRSGRVATLGPMRMHYERTIAATGEAAKLLDEAWAAHYGATEE
jgi:transcriptional regulator of heat shock response